MDQALILPVSSCLLAFGLDWLPLLSARAARLAYRTARQRRATHVVIAGKAVGAIGLANLRGWASGRQAPPHSAAQNLAKLHGSGTVALLMELAEDQHWLVAVHEGAVVSRTDKVFDSREHAAQALGELRQAFPQLTVLGEVHSQPAPSLAALAAASDESSRMQRVTRSYSGLSASAQYALLAIVLAFLLPKAWALFKPAPSTAPSAVTPDPEQAWRKATEQAGGAIAVHGVQATQAVLHSLYELPVRVAGWSFVNAGCEPEALGHWRCRARYTRMNAKASNETLLEKAPPSWAIEFTSIDHAEPSWRFQATAQSLIHARLRSAAHNERHLWSALQAIQPAFSRLQLGHPALLAVLAPTDPQGKPVPRPKQLSSYVVRSVLIEGPLRSASVLLPYTESIRWKKVSLLLHDARAVDVRTSRLHVSFQGDLYEIQSGTPEAEHNASAASQYPGNAAATLPSS